MSTKRARHEHEHNADAVEHSDESDATPDEQEPAHKAARAEPAVSPPPLMCYLPPTCCPPHGRPTPLANTRELEAHYARVHAHVCAAQGCAKVFPDARLLELHHTECHDPLAAMRKERGEKIFRCHVATCPKVCATAKTRRLHLIEAHHYPKQYFFAITNRGIGDLIARWGESASLLRPEWKPRPGQLPGELDMVDGAEQAPPPQPQPAKQQQQQQRAKPTAQREPPPHLAARQSAPVPSSSTSATQMRKDTFRSAQPASSDEDDAMDQDPSPSRRRTVRFADDDSNDEEDKDGAKASLGDGLDALAQQLSNISFVPRSVQFGRGGAHRGFEHRSASAPVPDEGAAEDEDGKKKTRRTTRGGRGRSRKKNRNRAEAQMAVDGDGAAQDA